MTTDTDLSESSPATTRGWRRRWIVVTMVGVVVAVIGGGAYLAGAAGTTATPTKAVIQATVVTAANVDQSLFSAPVTTGGSLHMEDVAGEAQQSVSATSTPWVLCPGARGATLSATAVHQMATYSESQVTAYFTGVQEQQELEKLARILTGTTTPSRIATAQPRGCSASTPPKWTISGPSLTSVAQWNSVVQTGTTATVSVVLLFNQQTCAVSSSPSADGTYAVSCPAPKRPLDGGTSVTFSLEKGADGQWRVDDMVKTGGGTGG